VAAAHAAEIRHWAAEDERAVPDRDAQIAAARARAAELARVCQEMADSLPWRVAEQGRRVLGKVAPPGSRRHRAWKGTVSAIKGRLRRAQGRIGPGAPAGGDEPLGCMAVLEGLEHGQWVRSEWSGLFEVRLRLGTFGRGNTCDLELTVTADP